MVMLAGLAALALATAPSPSPAQVGLTELTEIADISGLKTSPDGRWVAYRVERPSIERDAIELDWFVVDSEGGAPPRRIGSGGDATWNSSGLVDPGEAHWLPDSRAFVVRALTGGRIGLRTMPLDATGQPDVVADADIGRFAAESDGDLMFETGASRDAIARAEEKERDIGVLVDARVDLAQPLFRGGIVNGRPASQRWTGRWFERGGLLDDAPRTIWVRRAVSGSIEPAPSEEAPLLDAAPPPLPEEARRALRATGAGNLSSAFALPHGRWIMTAQDEAIRQSLFLWSPDASACHALYRGDGLINGGREENSPCAEAADGLMCVEAHANQPPRLVRIALDGGRVQIIDEPNRSLPGGELLAVPFAWQVGGSRASGWFIRPKFPGRLPLFLTYYRCSGYLRGGLGDEWPLRALAANGIAALCINALPLDDDSASRRYDRALAVVGAVIDRLDADGHIDRSRVGMGGLSFGSEVTMWIAAHSELIHAASIASVQIEPAYYWFNRIGDIGRFAANFSRYWNLGDPDATWPAWRRLAPALNADRIRIPVLMQLPEDEARLSPELHARLLAAGASEVRVFPFAPHIKVAPRQKLAVYDRNLDWFRFWLRGAIDPAPGKMDQYRRWDQMKAQRAASTARIQSSRSAISINRK